MFIYLKFLSMFGSKKKRFCLIFFIILYGRENMCIFKFFNFKFVFFCLCVFNLVYFIVLLEYVD